MKELILDYSKWRCGGLLNHKLGKGETKLLNQAGFMCCLGQFAPQLNPEVTPESLIGLSMPNEVGKTIKLLTTSYGRDGYDKNTNLAWDAAAINDKSETTPTKKIKLLKELFAKEGYEIKVINHPNKNQLG